MSKRELMQLVGYTVYQHHSHVGPLYGWNCPMGKGSHKRTEEEAWAEAEAFFEVECQRTLEICKQAGFELILPKPLVTTSSTE